VDQQTMVSSWTDPLLEIAMLPRFVPSLSIDAVNFDYMAFIVLRI